MSSQGPVVRTAPRQMVVRRAAVLGALLTLALATGLVGVARAEKDCPEACVKCREKGGVYFASGFCMLPLPADKTILEDILVDDPWLQR